ncbi:hypothetical protein D5039_21555 [Verminephrobacter aporrectodeae subsp. tuberculatae]|uniref:Uncharacterized protein n=1 Tax=Verminephrobacter aporrectodeae subsp. tuberculatae TaxID=1110392 RepID=A0ABT3KZ91_9BURK|nr:hypothetical protein [Verminephrobacter aporrectodeae]MCW5323637.1 hypothetical protein [Verminephrobacter aporrectodeae subsp. tuberculatae]
MKTFTHYAVYFELDDYSVEHTCLAGFTSEEAFDEFVDFMQDMEHTDKKSHPYRGVIIITKERAAEIKKDKFSEENPEHDDDWARIDTGVLQEDWLHTVVGFSIPEEDFEPRWKFYA